MTEKELLEFLGNNLRKWHGKPDEINGAETQRIPMGDIWRAINATGESFSPMFVISLFSILQQVADSTARQADEYGRFYNDPEKTLDELKQEHDLKGFNEKLKPGRKKGGETQAKKLHKKSRKPEALLVLKNWTGDRKDFIEFAINTYEVGDRQAGRWWKEGKG